MSDNNNGENFGILLIVILVCPPLIALLLWVLMELDWIKPLGEGHAHPHCGGMGHYRHSLGHLPHVEARAWT
jgi:hypothetical protein